MYVCLVKMETLWKDLYVRGYHIYQDCGKRPLQSSWSVSKSAGIKLSCFAYFYFVPASTHPIVLPYSTHPIVLPYSTHPIVLPYWW